MPDSFEHMPSVAIRSPGLTTMQSPIRSSLGVITVSVPSRSTVAWSGASDSRARRPRRVRAKEYSSRPSLMENRKASAAASPTSPRMTAPNDTDGRPGMARFAGFHATASKPRATAVKLPPMANAAVLALGS